ncbi:MAG: tRNA wybutosine-synthesizing 3 family protein [Candidatus Woesearchaeota archaeon]
MTFPNWKKTYLQKLDKSQKGEIDELVLPLIKRINQEENYFTTSSCSGRVFLWTGTDKKNEVKRIRVSHDPINTDFFKDLEQEQELVWLRLEPFIMHVCCQDIGSANNLLDQARQIFKKSSLLSISNKIIVEIKGSELLEIPLLKEGEYLIKEEKLEVLISLVNERLEKINKKINWFLVSFEQGKGPQDQKDHC